MLAAALDRSTGRVRGDARDLVAPATDLDY